MSQQNFVGRVIGAASQGAVGAVVAASLSAVTEPPGEQHVGEENPSHGGVESP